MENHDLLEWVMMDGAASSALSSLNKNTPIHIHIKYIYIWTCSKQICGWILIWEKTGDGLFHWRKCYYGLWTHSLVKNVLMGFISYKQQILSSQDVNWWTGVVWITCGLLWCFYQLFGLTAPIHCRASIVMECYFSKSKTHLHLLWSEGEEIVSKSSFLEEPLL